MLFESLLDVEIQGVFFCLFSYITLTDGSIYVSVSLISFFFFTFFLFLFFFTFLLNFFRT